MLDRTWTLKIIGWLACTMLAGCATPYTYYCEGNCAPTSLSGRFHNDASCSQCGSDSCSECASDEGTVYIGFGPTDLLKRTLTCNSGCGEIYWGEWSYDPPDDCDPCNEHGDWMGSGTCCSHSSHIWSGLWAGIHGQRIQGNGGACTDCDNTWEGDSSDGVEIDGLTVDIPPQADESLATDDTQQAVPPQELESPANRAPAHIASVPPERHPQSRLVRKKRVRR